jgi:hypothetical protein
MTDVAFSVQFPINRKKGVPKTKKPAHSQAPDNRPARFAYYLKLNYPVRLASLEYSQIFELAHGKGFIETTGKLLAAPANLPAGKGGAAIKNIGQGLGLSPQPENLMVSFHKSHLFPTQKKEGGGWKNLAVKGAKEKGLRRKPEGLRFAISFKFEIVSIEFPEASLPEGILFFLNNSS